MKKIILVLILGLISLAVTGCNELTQEAKDNKMVQAQQSQYAIAQPVPQYDWSMERDLLIKLYNLRNKNVTTHSVWRSDYGIVEGDCASLGYGLPYDTSLTNPYQAVSRDQDGYRVTGGLTAIGQSEPNGIFASTNTSATWVMCIGEAGSLDPIYVESKVTTYPYPVKVDYDTNRVKKSGKSTASIKLSTKNSK